MLLDAAEQLHATAYTTGTGTGPANRVITALVGTGSLVASAGADVFARADVYAVQNALPPQLLRQRAVVRQHRDHQPISQFETTAGARTFPEVSEGRLLNKPLNELSNMDGVVNAAQENYILLYGDFSNFVIADRIGTTLELIPNLVGANRRPTGQRGALLWFRTGSDSVVTTLSGCSTSREDRLMATTKKAAKKPARNRRRLNRSKCSPSGATDAGRYAGWTPSTRTPPSKPWPTPSTRCPASP